MKSVVRLLDKLTELHQMSAQAYSESPENLLDEYVVPDIADRDIDRQFNDGFFSMRGSQFSLQTKKVGRN